MRITLLSSFFLFCVTSLMGQIRINGRIVDEKFNPLFSVHVQTIDQEHSVSTNRDGYFDLMISADYKVVIVQYIGLQTDTVGFAKSNKLDIIMIREINDGIEGYIYPKRKLIKWEKQEKKRIEKLYKEARKKGIFDY